MANWIQYGDKKLPMGDMKLSDALDVMKRHFPELANCKSEEKKDGEDTIYVVSKQAGTKGSDLNTIAGALLTIKQHTFFNPRTFNRVQQVIAGQDADVSQETLERWTRTLYGEADTVGTIRTRIEQLPSAYSAGEVILL